MEPGSAADMNDSLYIIASQALPKLCAEFGLIDDSDSEPVPGLAPARASELQRRRVETLLALFRTRALGWLDVFSRSDIGIERRMVAESVPRGSRVLDVGCGRGYFTFACLGRAGTTVSLDMMGDRSRKGWWREFRATAAALGFGRDVLPVRASAITLPFGAGSFDAVASVHAIRNMDPAEVRSLIDEAFRVTAKGGLLVVAESVIDDSDRGAYAELFRIRVRMGWESAFPGPAEISRWAEAAGFREVGVQLFDTALRYAPIGFPFDELRMQGLRKRYEAAVTEMRATGERHPSVFVLTARR